MSATKYQIFLKTVECGSFTKAAADLNFSQSGISHAISSLEEELGVTLLSRNRGGVTLTGDGRALLPQIQQLCTEYHRLAQQAADLRGMDAGLVKVASFSSVSAQWLPMILKAFSKLYPAIEFEIQTCDFYDQIEELIITGQADCGFLRMPSLKGLQVYPLHLDQLKVIVPCGHPLANSDPFPVEALKGFGGGDGYASSFLYGILNGLDLMDCLELGSASASMLVASHGCSPDMPTVEELKAFIKKEKEQYGEMVARVE